MPARPRTEPPASRRPGPRTGHRGGLQTGRQAGRQAGRILALALAAGAAVWPAGAARLVEPLAASRAEPLVAAGGGTVVEVVDGDTVLLDTGVEVRLVGIQAPKLPLGRPNFKSWPLAGAAKAALERLIGGRHVGLAYGGRRTDRHGRALAHLHRDDGLWAQGEMLRLGLARVYTFRDNIARAAEMLALERAARAARRGIWRHPFYQVRTVAEAAGLIDTFQLVEGRVMAAAVVRGRVYLNFGSDWRDDFTIAIAPRDRRRFTRAGIAPDSWGGRLVRVRGWLKRYNGPMIEANHPEQIELLAD